MEKYIVIDKETGEDISSKVKVMKETFTDYKYCRMMADEMFKKADVFHKNFVMKALNAGNYEEYDKRKKEWKEMIDIAGDWEDKEFAARLMPLINSLSVNSDNPLLSKFYYKDAFRYYVEEMKVPSLGKYI